MGETTQQKETKARLTLTSVQTDGTQNEKSVSRYDCTLKCVSGGWLIKYFDCENGGSTVMLKISADCAEIRRSGKYSALRMKIEPDVESTSFVKTPYGEFKVPVKGISAGHSLSEKGGTAELCYFNGSVMSLKLEVKVK